MQRGRGQPRATTHDAIHQAAVDLFREAGFVETTMPMIAERAGIGRSTLFRYFSSKADILWHGYIELTADFARELRAQPDGVELADGAFEAYRSLWSAAPERTTIGKEVTLILDEAPPESTGRWRVEDAWSGLIREFVLARSRRHPEDTRARAAAAAIWAAIWSGAVGFARSDAGSIDDHLAQARAAIDISLPPARS